MKKSISRFGLLVILASAGLAGALRLAAQPARQLGGVGITVFRDENYRGRNATFLRDVPDLHAVELNDRISSLRVGAGEFWEACEQVGYRGRCVVFSGEERDLRRVGWSDKISSLRRVRRGGSGYPQTVRPRGGLILYDEPGFRGNALPLDRGSRDLREQGFTDSAESVRVLSGAWELCVDESYRDCRTVDRDVADLRELGLRKRVSSVRPVSGYPYSPR